MFDQADNAGKTEDLSNEAVVYQRTLKSPITCVGVGLHSGNEITMVLNPAPANSGVVFVRTDASVDPAIIPARWDKVVDTRLCSVLGNEDGVTVGTVEHVMAALAGCGVDNIQITIDGGEVPIMDGSSEPFVALIESSGVVDQNEPRRVIRVLKRIEVGYGAGHVAISPADTQIIDFEIDFDSNVVKHQEMSLKVVNGAFRKELSKARTFGFLHEVEALWEAGLAKGGSLDNAIVVSHDGVMNEDVCGLMMNSCVTKRWTRLVTFILLVQRSLAALRVFAQATLRTTNYCTLYLPTMMPGNGMFFAVMR